MQKSTRNQTIAILLIALSLRLVVLWTVIAKYPAGWLFTRGQEMGLLAQSLIEGHGLGSPFGPPTGPTAFIAPGYPLLVAAVFKLFGTYSVTSAVVIMSAQIALNLATIYLMMQIAAALFDSRVALIAGLIWACSLPLIWIPTIFWDTSLAICMLTGVFAFVSRLRARMTPRLWILLGAGCSLTALVNPAMLPVLGTMVCWLVWQQPTDRPRALALAALTGLLVFSPWPIRNARVFHAFIPLRTTVGFELWMGNRADATGFLDESLFPSFNPHELADYKLRGELGYTQHKSELAKQFIASHPATFAKLTTLRIVRYWLGSGSQNGSPIFTLHAATTTFFGFAGLWLLVRRRRYAIAILFAAPFILFPIPYYITHAEFRYRLALDTLLSILTAYAMVTLYRRMRAPASLPEALRAVHG